MNEIPPECKTARSSPPGQPPFPAEVLLRLPDCQTIGF